MRSILKALVGVTSIAIAASAAAQVTLYERDGFRGHTFSVNGPVPNLDRTDFNDRASSAIVERGRWLVCEDAYFKGRCTELRPGEYWSLDRLGMNNRISSIRPIGGDSYGAAPPPGPVAYGYERREGERLYEVPVASVRAVVGPPEQRCWVEREQVQSGGGPNVPGAIVGGVIGGILGHQIGSGRGNDAATAGGAVAGAAIGANVNRGGGEVYDRDVQRCASVPSSSQPAYWDVAYEFRGSWHHVQMSSPPGPRITVNENGEPRA
ncbi:MAG: glycine zipper 2TM domain-containing protein [Betaproteobacteria bacterium]|nr:MAG: glycine zipper 2TM domain-containing protein [Betaproteobacteria bacterium]